jgi:hypothetical protein
VAHADRKVLRYFIVLWFVGTGVVPVLQLVSGYTLNNTLFAIGGWIGYFILGLYLADARLGSKTLYGLLVAGYASTIAGTYLVTYFVGGPLQYFFLDYFSFTVILASVALFGLLTMVPANYAPKFSVSAGSLFYFLANYRARLSLSASKVIHFVSSCSLAIFLFHVIVLESLQRGYLGVRISIMTINPIVEIPLVTALTFLICLALLYPASKVSIFKRLFGIID